MSNEKALSVSDKKDLSASDKKKILANIEKERVRLQRMTEEHIDVLNKKLPVNSISALALLLSSRVHKVMMKDKETIVTTCYFVLLQMFDCEISESGSYIIKCKVKGNQTPLDMNSSDSNQLKSADDGNYKYVDILVKKGENLAVSFKQELDLKSMIGSLTYIHGLSASKAQDKKSPNTLKTYFNGVMIQKVGRGPADTVKLLNNGAPKLSSNPKNFLKDIMSSKYNGEYCHPNVFWLHIFPEEEILGNPDANYISFQINSDTNLYYEESDTKKKHPWLKLNANLFSYKDFKPTGEIYHILFTIWEGQCLQFGISNLKAWVSIMPNYLDKFKFSVISQALVEETKRSPINKPGGSPKQWMGYLSLSGRCLLIDVCEEYKKYGIHITKSMAEKILQNQNVQDGNINANSNVDPALICLSENKDWKRILEDDMDGKTLVVLTNAIINSDMNIFSQLKPEEGDEIMKDLLEEGITSRHAKMSMPKDKIWYVFLIDNKIAENVPDEIKKIINGGLSLTEEPETQKRIENTKDNKPNDGDDDVEDDEDDAHEEEKESKEKEKKETPLKEKVNQSAKKVVQLRKEDKNPAKQEVKKKRAFDETQQLKTGESRKVHLPKKPKN